jgi:BMFP domain-containing protein YqiC
MKPKHLLALGVVLAGATAAASLTAAQKPAPPQPTEQQKLKERVDTLESQLKEAQAKADRAAMEKDYLEKTQQHYESYYEKVHTTQLWTLGIMGLILTVVTGSIAIFGLDIFERRIQDRLDAASAKLREEFNIQMKTELQTLRNRNDDQLKALEDSLKQQIAKEVGILNARAAYVFHYSQGLTFGTAEHHRQARRHFRWALETYLENRESFRLEDGTAALADLFRTIKYNNHQEFHEEGKKELTDPIYRKLENELNAASLDIPDLAPLLKERSEPPPGTPKS